MDIRKLEHFLAVAEELSFTKAAARLHVVQSGVSASVKALEGELGLPLFERTTQRVELSVAGQALLPQARRILSAVRDAHQAVEEVRVGLRGTLELGILYGITPAEVPASLAAFRADYPAVEIHLVAPGHAGSIDHAESLRQGTLELAYLMTTGPIPGLRLHALTTEPLLLACAADHPLAVQSTVDLVDLIDAAFIDFPLGWGVRGAVDRSFAAAGLEHRRTTLEINDLSTVLDLVRHRLGIAFVPQSFCARAPDLCFLPVREHVPSYQIVVASARERPLSPVAHTFLNAVLRR
jgi:DNA-binding transcriptional LysR family regulator